MGGRNPVKDLDNRLVAQCPEDAFLDIKSIALNSKLRMKELILLSLTRTLQLNYTAKDLGLREEAEVLFSNLIEGE